MEIIIRKIEIEDATEVNLLSIQLGYSLPIEETEKQIAIINESRNDLALVAVDNGNIIAWIHAFKAIRLESKIFIEIGGLVVDEKYRNKKVGSTLIDEIKNWCIAESIEKIRVRCNEKRLETHFFYSKVGFENSKNQKIFEIQL